MPVIRVIGFEAGDEICLELIGALKDFVSYVDDLGVTPEQVSPFIERGTMQVVPGEQVIVYIDGLFDKEERTPAVCQKLTDAVYGAVQLIVKKYELYRSSKKLINEIQ